MSSPKVRDRVARMMPGVMADLSRLSAIASVSSPGFPPGPMQEMAEATVTLLRDAGFADAAVQEVPDGYPPIYARVPGPPGSPTVMLYAHYDVQPAPVEQGWTSDPFVPVTKTDGRLYGRGVADDKSGIAIHAATLQAFAGSPPCTVKLIVEGMEETAGNLEPFVLAHPDLFACDVFVVADMGNLRAADPILTTSLRGEASCIVTVRTLAHPLHSGVFGGPVPDALMALVTLLSTLLDDDGAVAVPGLSGTDWDGGDLSEADLRAMADLPDEVALIGTGTVGSRLWSKPSLNVVGLDTTSIAGSSNVLLPSASAKISLRIVPGSDPERELSILMRFLEAHAPWGAQVGVEKVRAAPGFICPSGGPGHAAARAAMEEAFGAPPGEAGSGGSIPLLDTLRSVAPQAEFILWGAEDMARCRIHASDESVDPAEIERLILAQVCLLERLAGLS